MDNMKLKSVRQVHDIKPLWLVASGCVILAISGLLWWKFVYQEPSRVFWGAVSNSLQTSAVTRRVSQSGNDLGMDQVLVMQYGSNNSVLNRTTLKHGQTTIVTEQIGLPDADYTRYTKIQTEGQDKATGQEKQDLEKVVNKWAKTSIDTTKAQQQPSLFAQSSIGLAGGNLIPIANLPDKQHDSLMRLMRDGQVFAIDMRKVKRETVAGRPTYTYPVDIQAVPYAALQKTYSSMLGSKMLENVDPSEYKSQASVRVDISIDVWSRQIRKVDVASEGRAEKFSSYGVGRRVIEPNTSITGEQLQELVKNL